MQEGIKKTFDIWLFHQTIGYGAGTGAFLINKRKVLAERVVQKLTWKLSTCQLKDSLFFLVLHAIKSHLMLS